MPTSEQNKMTIKGYQDQAISLNKEAAGYTAGSNVLGDRVMEAVRNARTERGVSKLATDVGNVSGQMVSDPNAIRATQSQGLIDPFSVNQLTSSARAQNLRTLGTISTQETLNQGSIDEVIQAGANRLKAKAATLLAEAEAAAADADALQQEWDRMFKEKQFNEEVRQFNVAQSNKGGSGGSTKEKDAGSFAEDGLGFSAQIAEGTVTWQQAHDALSMAYPWASEEEIAKFIGGPTPTTPTGTGESTGTLSRFMFPGQSGYDITQSNFQKAGDWLRSGLSKLIPAKTPEELAADKKFIEDRKKK